MGSPYTDIASLQAVEQTQNGHKEILHIIYDDSMSTIHLAVGYRMELWKEGKKYELVAVERE